MFYFIENNIESLILNKKNIFVLSILIVFNQFGSQDSDEKSNNSMIDIETSDVDVDSIVVSDSIIPDSLIDVEAIESDDDQLSEMNSYEIHEDGYTFDDQRVEDALNQVNESAIAVSLNLEFPEDDQDDLITKEQEINKFNIKLDIAFYSLKTGKNNFGNQFRFISFLLKYVSEFSENRYELDKDSHSLGFVCIENHIKIISLINNFINDCNQNRYLIKYRRDKLRRLVSDSKNIFSDIECSDGLIIDSRFFKIITPR